MLPRALHLLWFWLSGLMFVAFAVLLVSFQQRGRIGWQDVGDILVAVLPACLVPFIIGLLLRWRWLRKKKAAQAFELRLEGSAPLDF